MIWKKKLIIYIVYILCLLILNGCIGFENEVSDSQQSTPVEATAISTPILSPPLTSTPFSAATVFSTSTNQPQENTPTPTIQNAPNELEAQESEETSDACVDTTLIFTGSENGRVRWRVDDVGEGFCCHVTGIYKIYRNPDPDSNLVVFSVLTDGTVPIYSANVLVDLTTGDSKILGHDYIDAPRYLVDWLTDETVLWVDEEGEMYVGSLETQESFNAPAKMTDMWLVSPDLIVTRDEAYQFWYFDLINSVWTQLPANESEKITWRWIDYAAVSDDSDYLFFFFESYSAILFLDSRTIQTATPTFTSEDKYYVIVDSTEGDTFLPPQQIKGTPFWFFRTEWVIREFSQINYPSKGFIVDSRTGEVVEHEVLGIPPELAIYDAFLSPDRTWAAVEVVEDIQTLKTYPGQVSQTWFISLATGESHVEDGEFAGWEAESQDYLNAPLSCTNQEITIDLASPAQDCF